MKFKSRPVKLAKTLGVMEDVNDTEATVVKIEGEEEENGEECSICQIYFSSLELLSDHMRTQHEEKHNETVTTATPSSSSSLVTTKFFPCGKCDKSFKEVRTLRLHLKIHNSEYPEHCTVCQKAFRTKWQLKQHQMDHGGERPYPCPECAFTCKTKQQLNEHRRKHSGEKAYSCSQCGTRFTYRNGLIKHTKLNRCPKKVVTPEGETILKKRSRAKGKSNIKIDHTKSVTLVNTSDEEDDLRRVSMSSSSSEGAEEVNITSSAQQIQEVQQQQQQPQQQQRHFDKNGNLPGQVSPLPQTIPLIAYQEVGHSSSNNSHHHHHHQQLILNSAAAIQQLSSATGLSAIEIRNWAANLPAGSMVKVTQHYAGNSSNSNDDIMYANSNNSNNNSNSNNQQELIPRSRLHEEYYPNQQMAVTAVDPNEILRKTRRERGDLDYYTHQSDSSPSSEEYGEPSPSNRNLLERMATLPDFMEMSEVMMVSSSSSSLPSEGDLNFDEQDYHSIKTIVDQTFGEGRGLMDVMPM